MEAHSLYRILSHTLQSSSVRVQMLLYQGLRPAQCANLQPVAKAGIIVGYLVVEFTIGTCCIFKCCYGLKKLLFTSMQASQTVRLKSPMIYFSVIGWGEFLATARKKRKRGLEKKSELRRDGIYKSFRKNKNLSYQSMLLQ